MTPQVSRRTILVASAIALIVGSVGWYSIRRVPRLRESGPLQSDAYEWLRLEFPRLVALSPDGTQMLLKEEATADDTYALVVADSSGAVKVRSRSMPAELLLNWNPRSTGVAFQMDEKNDGRSLPYFWDLQAGTVVQLDHLPMRSARRYMRWTSSGDRLALFVDSADKEVPNQVRVIDFRQRPAVAREGVRTSGQVTDFGWSSSGSLAVADGGRLSLIDSDSAPMRTLGAKGMDVAHLSWCPDNRALIVTGRDDVSGAYVAAAFDSPTGTLTRFISSEDSLEYPYCLGPQTEFLFHRRVAGGRRLALHSAARGSEDLPLPPGEAYAYSVNQNVANVLHSGPFSLPRLYRVDARTRSVLFSYAHPASQQVSGTPGEVKVLASGKGTNCSVVVFRPRDPGAAKVAVVRVFGLGGMPAPTTNVFREYLLKKNLTVVDVIYRGSQSDSPEAAGDSGGQLADVRAAYRFVRDQLGFPEAAILLYGQSYGTELVVRAVAAEAAHSKMILVSVTPPRRTLEPATTSSPPMVVFQGDRDPVRPEKIRSQLDRVWKRSNAVYADLQGEGHVIRHLRSWSRIAAAMTVLRDSMVH